jgi:hemerythrin-like domain-containing protein
MKATDYLKKQHREVMKLFKQVENTDDARERKRLMSDIVAQLKVHTKIEEEIFYPAVKEIGTEKAEEMMLEAVEEHHVVDLVLAEIPKVDPAADTFEAKMTVLRELIEHHVEEEQDEVFPMAEKRLGKERIAERGERLEERSEALEARAA